MTGVKLICAETSKFVTPCSMLDGQIGVIIKWTLPEYIGTIIQKVGSSLIILGIPSCHGWSEVNRLTNVNNFKIRILKPRELLEIL